MEFQELWPLLLVALIIIAVVILFHIRSSNTLD